MYTLRTDIFTEPSHQTLKFCRSLSVTPTFSEICDVGTDAACRCVAVFCLQLPHSSRQPRKCSHEAWPVRSGFHADLAESLLVQRHTVRSESVTCSYSASCFYQVVLSVEVFIFELSQKNQDSSCNVYMKAIKTDCQT